jgi:hypothetical protein
MKYRDSKCKSFKKRNKILKTTSSFPASALRFNKWERGYGWYGIFGG